MFSVRRALLRTGVTRNIRSGNLISTTVHARGGDAVALDADIGRALEKAERASDSWQFEVTDFYPPPVIAEVVKQVSNWADVSARIAGGYSNAERCRLVVAREELVVDEAAESEFVKALQVRPWFLGLPPGVVSPFHLPWPCVLLIMILMNARNLADQGKLHVRSSIPQRFLGGMPWMWNRQEDDWGHHCDGRPGGTGDLHSRNRRLHLCYLDTGENVRSSGASGGPHPCYLISSQCALSCAACEARVLTPACQANQEPL